MRTVLVEQQIEPQLRGCIGAHYVQVLLITSDLLKQCPPLVVVAFSYTVVFVAFITFTTSLWLMTRYPASRVMAFLMITPAFGVAAGVVLLSEPLTINLGAGLAVVILGLWLVNRPAARPTKI